MPSSISDDERQPLLPDDEARAYSAQPVGKDLVGRQISRRAASLRDFVYGNPILICTFGLQFCNYFAKHVLEVPIIKLLEFAICDRYYAIHGEESGPAHRPINEHSCKIPAIQNELTLLVGWKFTFDALPGKFHRYCLKSFGLKPGDQGF